MATEATEKNELTLADTVDLMLSEEPEDRLKAELQQLVIRKEKLGEKLREMQTDPQKSLDSARLGDLNLLRRQYAAMNHYESILKQRLQAAGLND